MTTLRLEDLAETHGHLLDDLEAHTYAVDRSNEYAVAHDLVKIPIPRLLGDVVSLEADQTPFRNQGPRGTCYAFAACAAVEAAYKRKHGVELDLSEQFTFHLNKGGELHTDYMDPGTPMHENNSSYWGFQGCSDMVDKLARLPVPAEGDASYLSAGDMDQIKASTPCGQLEFGVSTQEEVDAFEYDERHIPTPARQAARYRVTDFAALPPMPTSEQVEAVIRGGHEVVADVPGHCLLLVGFDHDRRVYMAKNSWGEGHFIELGYDSADWQIQGGRYVIDVDAVDAAPSWDAFWVGRWQMDHDGWRGDLVIRRTTDFHHDQGQPTKLGDYYRDGNRYAVNGLTSQDGQALHFWVADTTDKVAPGTQTGQEFWTYVYSQDCRKAAGTTTWGDSRFGVTLSRDAIDGTPSAGFEADAWLGDWAMNHDGWEGVLTITSVSPFAASYRTGWDGATVSVNGGLTGGADHYLELGIEFFPGNPQDFRLYGHTRENDVFSGITLWGGRVYGVQGHRAQATNPLLGRLSPSEAVKYPLVAHRLPQGDVGWH
jgi:Papain family cysteine protease